jgi:3(or 17)beta-hydroxysteroid dehydrogenase
VSKRLQNKVALVTGAGAGIGEAVAMRFAEEGAVVIVADIDGEAAGRVASEANARGGRVEARTQDVTDEPGWEALVADIVTSHGRLDVLVNNAGIGIAGNAEHTTLADWRRTQAVNGEGVMLGTRTAIGAMKERGGAIVNISSIEGMIGEPNAAAYNYSKGGVRIFTKSAALHCARQGYPIRVNSVHPGYIRTHMVEAALAQLPAGEAEEMVARVLRETPLGTLGEPLDIANGCLYLASDEAKFVTGSELVIDGGYTCH